VVGEYGGAVLAALDEVANGVGQEAVAAEVDAEACAGDDVRGDVFAGFELGVAEDELDATVVRVGRVHELGFGYGPAEELRKFAFDAAVEGGSAGWAEVLVDEKVADVAWEGLEDAGEVTGEPGAEAFAQRRGRMAEALVERALALTCRLGFVDVNLVSAGEEGDAGAYFVQQGGGIEGAGTTADDGDVVVGELIEGAVRGGVGDHVLGEMAEVLRDVLEEADACREDDVASEDVVATFESDAEGAFAVLALALDGGDVEFFEGGDIAAGEFLTVGDEVFDGDWVVGWRVIAAGELAEVLQGERDGACGEVGGEAVGLELHADGHLGGPGMHGLPEDSKGDTGLAQVGCERKAVGSGTDNDCMEKIVRVTIHVRVFSLLLCQVM